MWSVWVLADIVNQLAMGRVAYTAPTKFTTTLRTMALAGFVVPTTMVPAASIVRTASTYMVLARDVSTADPKRWSERGAFTARRVDMIGLANKQQENKQRRTYEIPQLRGPYRRNIIRSTREHPKMSDSG